MPHGLAAPTAFSRASTNRLTHHDLGRFEGTSLFARLGRVVCEAECLPRKELFEAWEMGRRVRRRLRGSRVLDLAGGHGLLAHALLLLDDSSPSAVVVDTTPPPSAARLHASIVAAWPRLAGRITYATDDLDGVAAEAGDLVVSCHACGGLTDRVLSLAVRARARVAVLPCCHETGRAPAMLDGWMDPALGQDVARAQRLAAAGYEVWTQRIPPDVTPKNRLLMGAPSAAYYEPPSPARSAQGEDRAAVSGKPA